MFLWTQRPSGPKQQEHRMLYQNDERHACFLLVRTVSAAMTVAVVPRAITAVHCVAASAAFPAGAAGRPARVHLVSTPAVSASLLLRVTVTAALLVASVCAIVPVSLGVAYHFEFSASHAADIDLSAAAVSARCAAEVFVAVLSLSFSAIPSLPRLI